MRTVRRRSRGATLAILVSLASCTREPSEGQPARSEIRPERVTQIPLAESGYVYDVAVADGAAWITTHSGLFRIDLATSMVANVLAHDYLFRVAAGHGAVWITTSSDGHVLRVDPASMRVTADIDVREGPVTDLAISNDAVWISATSDLVGIDPDTDEIVARLTNKASFGDIGFGGAGLWVIAGANKDGGVWQIDPVSNEVKQEVPLANPSFWNEVAVGDNAVWVTSSPAAHRDGVALVTLHEIDPSTGHVTAEVPLGDGYVGLRPDEGAVSYSALVLSGAFVWVLVNFEGQIIQVEPRNLRVRETLDGVEAGGSGVGPGMTIGAGSLWITGPKGITRINLEA